MGNRLPNGSRTTSPRQRTPRLLQRALHPPLTSPKAASQSTTSPQSTDTSSAPNRVSSSPSTTPPATGEAVTATECNPIFSSKTGEKGHNGSNSTETLPPKLSRTQNTTVCSRSIVSLLVTQMSIICRLIFTCFMEL